MGKTLPVRAPDSGHYEAGSDRGAERAAAIYTLLQTAKLNNVDPQAWLADVLSRIASHPAKRLHELLPWNWKEDQNASAD
jgi:transposase